MSRRLIFVALAGACLAAPHVSLTAQTPAAPKYKFDPDWPKTMPNKWKIGGVTGLAVDKDDNVWVYDRPNDLRDMELKAELSPAIADCCVRPPSMIHIDKNGNVIGSFDPPQGHGMAVDSKGFVYLGNSVRGMNTVRKYDPKTGQLLKEIPRIPETQGGGGEDADEAPAARQPGRGGPGPTGTFPAQRGGGAGAEAPIRRRNRRRLRQPQRFSPSTPEHADDRRPDRRGAPRRTGARALCGRQLVWRPRDGVRPRHVCVQARLGCLRTQALGDRSGQRGARLHAGRAVCERVSRPPHA